MIRTRIRTYQIIVVLSFLLGIQSITSAQSENKFIRRGNNSFEDGDYKTAEIDYRKALEKNTKSTKGTYNLGDAIYQQEAFEDAANLFGALAESDIPAKDKANAYHNLGNSLMQMQEFDAAIESYKNALRNNPDDLDTKYNLEYAKKMLQQQQQEQQQDEQNKDNQDEEKEDKEQEQKQDQEQNQDQKDNKDQQDQEQNQDQKQDQQQQGDQQQDQQQQQQQPKQISKEDAERMLQALKENEKKTLEKLKLEKLKGAQKVKSEKDW